LGGGIDISLPHSKYGDLPQSPGIDAHAYERSLVIDKRRVYSLAEIVLSLSLRF